MHPTAQAQRTPRNQTRSTLIDCFALALLCAMMYLPGITSLGLVNWQEGQRALVAREMLANNEWVVPTRGGEVYLAKPPMIYWCQMGLARARGSGGGAVEVEPIDLRLTVALAGILGVICTYLLARIVTNRDQNRRRALYSALGLAVGVLYMRSARVGELDILLVPCAVGAIGAVYYAWVCARRPAVRWLCIALASICCALAALTKGPPAIALIALVAFGAPAWYEARAHTTRWSWPPAVIGAIAFGAIGALEIDSFTDAIGALLHAAIGAMVGTVVSVLLRGGVRRWGREVFRLHSEIVIGAGVLALWVWGEMVGARVGDDVVQAAASAEAKGNLRLFVVDSPLKNIGFLAYGLLPIGLLGMIELWRIASRRSPVSRGVVLCVVWVFVGFVLMSVVGKGVARYLTPIWPGLAILGGMWAVRELHTPARRAAGIGVFGAAAIGMTVWYSVVRPARVGDTSPQAMIGELLELGATNQNIGTFGFDAPAAAFYSGGDMPWWPLRDAERAAEEIQELVHRHGSFYVLVRDEEGDGKNRAGKANARLRALLGERGAVIGEFRPGARYVRDRTGSEVGVWLVSDSVRR